MTIHELMREFTELGNALGDFAVGCGPMHPDHPDSPLGFRIEQHLIEYRFLHKDEGYVDFLKSYAGASLYDEKSGLVVDIFGFTGASTHIDFAETSLLLEGGYLAFCAVELPRGTASIFSDVHGFAIKADNSEGIYRIVMPDVFKEEFSFDFYCSSFLEWFELLLKFHGNLPDKIESKSF